MNKELAIKMRKSHTKQADTIRSLSCYNEIKTDFNIEFNHNHM